MWSFTTIWAAESLEITLERAYPIDYICNHKMSRPSCILNPDLKISICQRRQKLELKTMETEKFK